MGISRGGVKMSRRYDELPRSSRRVFLAGACGLGIASGQDPKAPPKADAKKAPGDVAEGMYSARAAELPPGHVARADASTKPYGGMRWRMQYQFDQDDTDVILNDLRFASPERGIAVGAMVRKGRDENFALVTRDGGLHWTQVKMKDLPYSLFLLDESRYFCVCQGSLWYSNESGATWEKRKLPKTKKGAEIARVHFLDEKNGWAYGAGLAVYRTVDGGLSWTEVPEANELKLKPENTEWAWMNWIGPKTGILVGTSAAPPPEGSRLPDWMIPERAMRRRAVPGSTIVLETRDGGATWKSSMVSSFGHVVRMRGGELAMTLFQYGESMEFSSEVYVVNLRGGSNRPYFRRKDVFVYDAVPLAAGGGLVAAIETRGRMRTSPIPGKLRIFQNTGAEWREMRVDYHASGVRAVLAYVDDTHIWAATSEGVILKLG